VYSRLLSGYTQARGSGRAAFPDLLRLQPGERRAEAEMRSLAEAEMLVCCSPGGYRNLRARKHLLVVIRRGETSPYMRTLRIRVAPIWTSAWRFGSSAIALARRRRPSSYCIVKQRSIPRKLLALLGGLVKQPHGSQSRFAVVSGAGRNESGQVES